jgi:hypothetical protein
MDYEKIYNQLIERARNRKPEKYGYYERHHIIPKCLGGSNNKNNLVKLTYREHFIAHWLLHRANPTNKFLTAAFHIMAFGPSWRNARKERGNGWMPSSRQLEEARIDYSLAQKGKTYTEETRKKIGEASLGRRHTEEARKKMSEAQKRNAKLAKTNNLGKKWITNGIDNRLINADETLPIGWVFGIKYTEEARKKMSEGATRNNLGKPHSEETKQKMREAKLGNVYNLGKKWITNGNDTRQINPDETLPIGWTYGRKKVDIAINKKWW